MTRERRLHVYYAGSVQGVGFRYTAERIALDLGLSGWVANLPDGRVEVVAEGPDAPVEKFLAKINDTFERHIRAADIRRESATGEFDGFEVKFL